MEDIYYFGLATLGASVLATLTTFFSCRLRLKHNDQLSRRPMQSQTAPYATRLRGRALGRDGACSYCGQGAHEGKEKEQKKKIP